MGYTPVFNSIFDGTLAGRWPTSAVWLTLLALTDAHGEIDMTPEAIGNRTGWPLDLLKQGIAELLQPDPRSRSQLNEGRRLVPIDSHRDWGWKVVNIQKYRDKASAQMRIEDGRNAEASRRYREKMKARRDTAKHSPTHTDTGQHSPTHTDTGEHSATHTQTVSSSSLRSEEEDSPSIPPHEGGGIGFSEFFRKYPKRVGRREARVIWDRLDESDRQRAFADSQRRAKGDVMWLREDGRYVPTPANYLEDQRWLDPFEPAFRTTPRNDDQENADLAAIKKLGFDSFEDYCRAANGAKP